MKYAGWQRVSKNAPMRQFFGGKSFFKSLPSPHKTSTTTTTTNPTTKPRSGSDANASGDGSFGGRGSPDEDPLDPTPPSPRSQVGPRTPVNLYHHRRSHHSLHNHTTAAGIAALAANASCAGNLLLPANAAFARRQRLRWAQPTPPSPSPPANPPTNDSTNPSSQLLRRNRDE